MGYSYLVQILPVLVVSPLYFAGSVELGVITQSTGAFNHVLNDLSIIVNQYEVHLPAREPRLRPARALSRAACACQ